LVGTVGDRNFRTRRFSEVKRDDRGIKKRTDLPQLLNEAVNSADFQFRCRFSGSLFLTEKESPDRQLLKRICSVSLFKKKIDTV
jgi:hypothetical protein